MRSTMSRRRFLGVTAGAVGAGLALPKFARAAEKSPYGDFQMGIQSYSLRGFPTDKALESVKDLGLHFVEFYDGHFSYKSSPEQIDAMKNNLRSLGIKMTAHGVNDFGK